MAKELVEALEVGDQMSAEMIAATIAQSVTPAQPEPQEEDLYNQDHELYNEVGRLTRKVYEAVKELALDEKLAEDASELPRAQGDISYIVSTAESSATSTINAVEEVLPKLEASQETNKRLEADIDRFLAKEMPLSEFNGFIKELKAHTIESREMSQDVSRQMNEILMAQGFQDLTGQVANRVSEVLRTVEGNLLELIKIYGTEVQLETEKGCPLELTGPSTNPESDDMVVNGQDDVDDLLSSLGF